MTARILLRGGCVLTLGKGTPNLRRGDVLIEGDRIAQVGQDLRARDADVVDAAGAIVMPGFVDTHRHVWTSLFRNLDHAAADDATGRTAAERYDADAVYAATLIGLLGAVEAGITTVVDWSDLDPDEDRGEAALQAHAESGLRTVFVLARGATRETLARLARSAGPSTTIALGARLGHPGAQPPVEPWTLARELGLRMHLHGASPPGAIAALAARGFLGEDATLVHGGDLEEADLDALAASGAGVSLAPASEMAGGAAPPIQRLIDRGVRPGLGVDEERVAPGDLFAQMRAAISWQHAVVFERKLAGKGGLPRLLTTRDVIRWATVDGARAVGLGGVTGALEPGMRADVVLLRGDRPNVFPINDPIGAVVWGMDTSNVDTVLVGGRALLEGGHLRADGARARDLARAAAAALAGAPGFRDAALEGTG
ncbi:MAG TPA: amidohydrolase family protein [Actinomycetota bacterium]|nr:amidohydrolase family protein [Actinomycetota bacterium]